MMGAIGLNGKVASEACCRALISRFSACAYRQLDSSKKQASALERGAASFIPEAEPLKSAPTTYQ